MKLDLTPAQVEALTAHLRPGSVLLVKVTRETFTGDNADTAGRPFLEFGSVRESSLPALREAIHRANAAPAKKPKRSKGATP